MGVCPTWKWTFFTSPRCLHRPLAFGIERTSRGRQNCSEGFLRRPPWVVAEGAAVQRFPMVHPMPKNGSCLQWSAVALVIVVNVASCWYPFQIELPKRVNNTARQQQDGSWSVDGSSRASGYVPERAVAAIANHPIRLTVEAWPASPNLAGPARLFALGRSPYDASFMVGIERDDVVLRLPCGGARLVRTSSGGCPFRTGRRSWFRSGSMS
jgi:hypothetical protein